MWQVSLISAGLGFLSANKQRKQAKRQAEQDRLYQQEQNDLLEEQKQAYRDITFTNPVTASANYDATKDTHIASTLKTLLSYDETKNVHLASLITSSAEYESTKNVTIQSPISESFHYQPIRDIHIGSPVSESMIYEAEKKIVNTLAIQKDWIERITTWRLNVDVFVEGGNVNEIYEHWANQRTEEEYIKAWTK